MSAVKNLQWKRALSTLRFSHEELQYAKEVSREAATEFEAYYRRFCAENNIDIPSLEKQNKQRLDDYYVKEALPEQGEAAIASGSIGDSSITLYQNNQQEDQEYQMTADEIAIHDSFSKLFKKLALKLHPDRINKHLEEDEKDWKEETIEKANPKILTI